MQRFFLFLLFLSPTFLAAQVVDIPDPNFLAALIEEGVDTNGDGMIQVSEAEVVEELDVEKKEISNLEGIEAFVNLEILDVDANSLEYIFLEENLVLRELSCSSNDLIAIDVSNNFYLEILKCSSNELEVLDLESNDNLRTLTCSLNNLTSINLSSNPNLERLNCNGNEMVSLLISNNPRVEYISCSSNEIAELDLSNNSVLNFLDCSRNNLVKLNTSFNPLLETLECSINQISEIDVSNNPLLDFFYCNSNDLEQIDVSNNSLLKFFSVATNRLTEVNVSNNPLLEWFFCTGNQIHEIDVSNLELLEFLNCSFNNIEQLSVSDNYLLERLFINNNQINEIDISNNPLLERFSCSNNLLSELNFTSNKVLKEFVCNRCRFMSLDFKHNKNVTIDLNDSYVSWINFANGSSNDTSGDSYYKNDSLRYLCVDQFDIAFVQEHLDNQIDQVSINTYCNFSLNYGLNCLQGKNQYDINGSCDNTSVSVTQVPFSIQDSIQEYKWWPAYNDDIYKMFFPSGPHVVKHCLDSALFTSNPDFIELDFLGVEDTVYQDFCVRPNPPLITDMAISLVPLNGARAGFASDYKIIIENLGNLFSSGTIVLDFPMDSVQLISSSEAFTLNGNQATWNYTDLPILSRQTITFKTRTNSPMDTPAIEGGEILKFRAEVIPDMTDANPIDNTTTLCQTVVNSFDPNDKRCLQGRTMDESQVGSFLDYIIRFENTGSAEAINITVQDTLDTEVYDISTFRLLDASHSLHVSQKGNAIEFIFNDINLSHVDSLNDGYVAFKIKTLDNLEIGDSIKNKAAIYFDFNWPIITNEALTIIGRDQDGDGYTILNDCDDNDPLINPGVYELCDGIDNNCNNMIDEGLVLVNYYQDIDQDGFGDDATVIVECSPLEGLITVGGDCDDTDPTIFPGAEELCDGIDNNCSGLIDEDLEYITWYQDMDGDGYGNNTIIRVDCTQPLGFVTISGDCDDNNVFVYPGATELCDGLDNNCNQNIDEDLDVITYYVDLDQDGYGDESTAAEECSQPAGMITVGGDCDDTNPNINPGQSEITYNGIDDDCNQETLDDDLDQDGFMAAEDCDDSNPSINPGATELCDNLDNNCNEAIDEDLEFLTYYLDLDSDGYGDDTTAREECSHPDGLIITGGDCDDTNPDINPAAEDIANNGIDENCDGEDAVSSIHELEQLGISLYPNPVDQLLYIQQDQLDNLNITMYNLEGKKVLSQLFSKSLNTVDVSALMSGVYIVKIQREDRVVNVRVVVR